MAIPLTGTGGLFTRFGQMANITNVILTSGITTLPPLITAVNNQFLATDQNIIQNLYSSFYSYQAIMPQLSVSLASMASAMIVQMANDDSPQPNTALVTSMIYLINQMKNTSQSVNRNTITGSYSSAGTNHGVPNIVISMVDRNGLLVENCFAESIAVTCIADSQSGGTNVGQELLSVVGERGPSNSLDLYYPEGSGVSVSMTAISASVSTGRSGSLIINGNFEYIGLPALASLPPWAVVIGTVGTTVIF